MASATQSRRPSKQSSAKSAASALDRYDVHEAANLFPMIDDENLQELAADIAEHGQQEPIWTFEGKLLDGRNRVVACAIAGVEPVEREWTPKAGETPASFVMSRNLHRRHLTKSQRATLAVELAEAMAAEREQAKKTAALVDPFSHKNEQVSGTSKTPETTLQFNDMRVIPQPRIGEKVRSGRVRDQAAKALDVSAGYVNDAKDLKRADPETYEKVRSGELTLARAQEKVVADAQAKNALEGVKLRPGAVRAAMERLEAENRPKRPEPQPAIKLPKATKVQSSRTTLSIMVTFGNQSVAEEWLNRMRAEKKVLDLSYEVVPTPTKQRRRRR